MNQSPGLASSVGWTALSQVCRVGAQLLGLLLLARLLPASDFGLIAMGSVVVGFIGLFRDFGSSAAIIQAADPSPSLLDSVFWLNIGFSVVLVVTLGALSPVIASGFSEPRLREVLWVLMVSIPIVGLATVQQALLERSSRFRSLAVIEAISAVVGVGAAILAANAGWGVFSLAMQSISSSCVATLGVWKVSRWRPRVNWDVGEIRRMARFSGNLVGFNVFNYFIRMADSVLIGRVLGATELGYYTIAYRLMLWPIQNISAVIARASFPAFSRLRASGEEVGTVYVQATAAIAFVTTPLMVGFFVLRESFVTVTLGREWTPVVEILAWLVPVGMLQSVGTLVGTLYLATGRTDVMFRWGVGAGLILVTSFAVGLQWGTAGVAAAYAFASVALFWPSLAIPFRWVGIKVSHVLIRVAPTCVTTAAMALVLIACSNLWPPHPSRESARLGLLIILGIASYVVVSVFVQRQLLNDAWTLVRRLLRSKP